MYIKDSQRARHSTKIIASFTPLNGFVMMVVILHTQSHPASMECASEPHVFDTKTLSVLPPKDRLLRFANPY